MTKFCENCPVRNGANSEIIGIVGGPVKYTSKAILGLGSVVDSFDGFAAALIDDSDNMSLPLKFPSRVQSLDEAKLLAETRIGECSGPTTEQYGLFKRKVRAIGCPAVGNSVILSEGVRSQFFNIARVELM